MSETLQHLLNVEQILPSKNNATTILKSYYLTRFRTLSQDDDKNFNADKRCSHCCTPWTNGKYKFKVTPLKKPNKSSRGIFSDILKQKPAKKAKALKKAQTKLTCNYMNLLCLVCNLSTKIEMTKREKLQAFLNKSSALKDKTTDRKNKKIKDVISSQTVNTKQASKEKPTVVQNRIAKQVKGRVSDRFAGLCASVCMSIQNKKSCEKKDDNPLNMFLRPSG